MACILPSITSCILMCLPAKHALVWVLIVLVEAKSHLSVQHNYCARFATTRTGTVQLPMFCPGTTSPGDAFENEKACFWETAPVVY